MNRRTALLAGLSLLTASRASAHYIHHKPAGEHCTPRHPCLMCRHNAAHNRGLEHDVDGWYDPRTLTRPRVTELAKPESAPTPQVVVDKILATIKPGRDDIFLDPGCGDGRVLISAARYGCSCIGIEIDKSTAARARNNVWRAGLGDKISIHVGDSLKEQIVSKATVAVMYIYSDVIEKLLPRFTSARVVVSYIHPLPVQMQHKYRVDKHGAFYVWER